ncbi:MAG: hypothetical protein ACYSUI_17155 [Planctomycetota bacterium]|jgi:hypothetical protein
MSTQSTLTKVLAVLTVALVASPAFAQCATKCGKKSVVKPVAQQVKEACCPGAPPDCCPPCPPERCVKRTPDCCPESSSGKGAKVEKAAGQPDGIVALLASFVTAVTGNGLLECPPGCTPCPPACCPECPKDRCVKPTPGCCPESQATEDAKVKKTGAKCCEKNTAKTTSLVAQVASAAKIKQVCGSQAQKAKPRCAKSCGK